MPGFPRPTPAGFAWAEPYLTVGVTGTNGKTTTTQLVAAVLRAAGERVLCHTTVGFDLDGEALATGGSWEDYVRSFEIGAKKGCHHAAVEVTSQALAHGFAKRWRFDHGVFTNLTRDHLDSHHSFEHYLASKAQLFVQFLGPGRTAVLNAAAESALLVDQVTPPDVRRVWYAVPSRGPRLVPADSAARAVRVSEEGTEIELEPSPLADALGGTLGTRLIGEIFAENALAAAALGLSLGLAGDAVRRGVANAPAASGRFEMVHRAPRVVIDYAHTPDALARTCATARSLAGKGRVIVVFGAGGERDKGKRGPMGEAVGRGADYAIVTNDNPRREDPQEIARVLATGCRRGGRAHVTLELDRRMAIQKALERAKGEDVVVIAGRGHEREQFVGEEAIAFSDAELVRELTTPSAHPR